MPAKRIILELSRPMQLMFKFKWCLSWQTVILDFLEGGGSSLVGAQGWSMPIRSQRDHATRSIRTFVIVCRRPGTPLDDACRVFLASADRQWRFSDTCRTRSPVSTEQVSKTVYFRRALGNASMRAVVLTIESSRR